MEELFGALAFLIKVYAGVMIAGIVLAILLIGGIFFYVKDHLGGDLGKL